MRAAVLAFLLLSVSTFALGAPGDGDWPTYGHDKGGQRNSPLTQITPANVANLAPAWVYHLKPAVTDATVAASAGQQVAGEGAPAAPPKPKFLQSQMTPLVADGRMYITSPYGPV